MMKNKKLEHIKSKNSPFRVPEGYFNDIEDTTFSKLSEEKLPKNSGYTLPESYFDKVEHATLHKLKKEKFSKKTGFSLPENYLDSIEDHVLSKLNTKQARIIDFRSILLKRVLPIASAAAIALLILLNYNNNNTSIEKVAASEIEQWIENDQISFDTYQIAEVYSDVELENQTSYTEEELYDYLNGTDIESLLIEN